MEQGWIYLQDYWSNEGTISRFTGARIGLLGARKYLSTGLLEQYWIYPLDYWSKDRSISRITRAGIDLSPELMEHGWIYLQDY